MADHYAITGAKGTGKTTLLKRVASRIARSSKEKDFQFMESPGVAARSRGLSLGEMGTDQTHIFFAALHLKALDHHVGPARILDRCLIDHLAYVRTLSKDAAIIEMMAELTRVASRNYKKVFVTILHDGLPKVSGTSESDTFRRDIEVEILSILNEFEIPHTRLSPSLESAEAQVVETLLS